MFNFIVMFQPCYCNFFYSSFNPRLALGYFAGKDWLWHVSKVFLINLNLKLNYPSYSGLAITTKRGELFR